MLKRISFLLLLSMVIFPLVGCDKQPHVNNYTKTYYVDSINGDDNNTGLSEDDTIQSINKVNQLNLKPGDSVLFKCDNFFRGNLVPVSGSKLQRITYGSYGNGKSPILMGSFSINDIISDIQLIQDDIYAFTYAYDIGNLIINNGEIFGVKKFSIASLVEPLDYYYDQNKKALFLKADETLINQLNNSNEGYHSVEFCVTQNIVNMSNKHDLDFKNLAIKYGSAHGFGGYETHRVTIQNCQISYIGGGFLFYNESGEPVRYGNGVEVFNSGSYISVIGCEIFEIFDTAVTNQGSKKNSYHTDFTYENNIIYNCGMAAFELWNQGAKSSMNNITFKNNNVSNIGYGFSLTQKRENTYGLGHFITDFGNISTINNIVIEGNVFTNALNEYGLSSLLLISDLKGELEDYPIYTGINNNQVSDIDYKVTYVQDGEVYLIN